METSPDHNPPALIHLPQMVSREEWQRARERLLIKEKAATRYRDALNAERRRLPMVRVEQDYVFAGPGGQVALRDLFSGRRQLIVYHFMFAPGVGGWPEAGCPGCSMGLYFRSALHWPSKIIGPRSIVRTPYRYSQAVCEPLAARAKLAF